MNITIDLAQFAGVIGGLLIVGAILKNAFPSFPNRLIPLITLVGGVLSYLALTGGWKVGSQWVAALVAAATATGAHSGLKNTLEASGYAITKTVTILFLLFVPVAVTTQLTGCSIFEKTATPEAKKFYTFRDSWTLSKTAYAAWSEHVVQGKVSQADSDKVDKIWNNYRASFKTAIAVARQDWSAVTPETLTSLQRELITLIAQLSK